MFGAKKRYNHHDQTTKFYHVDTAYSLISIKALSIPLQRQISVWSAGFNPLGFNGPGLVTKHSKKLSKQND